MPTARSRTVSPDQTAPATRTSPRLGTSPATARRSEDPPAPLGPITPTTWPRSATAATLTRPGTVTPSSRPLIGSPAWARQPSVAEQRQDGDRDDQQHHAHGARDLRVALELGVDQ